MTNLADLSSSKTHRCIIYGGPKSGKTLLAGKLAEHYKLIWIDLENGYETLFQLPLTWQKNIELIRIPDTRSFPIAIETCLKLVKGAVSICKEHGKVGCMVCKRAELLMVDIDLPHLDNNTVVVFDSLTQLSNSAISHITKNQPDDYKLNYDDWGNLAKLLDVFLSHIQQAGYHVIVISHETEAETEGKKRTLVPVGGTRNFSRNIAKYFDEVIYAERKNRKHVFSSSSCYSANILTGSRTGISMEEDENEEGGSLLSIFKPELFTAIKTIKTTPITKTKTTGGTQAKDILARLKKISK